MKSSLARFLGDRPLGVACSIAMLFGAASNSACTATGEVSGPGAGTGNAASSGGAGNSPSGTAGAGSTGVIPPDAPSSTSWYDTLTAANCSGAPTALPSTRIWRLSALQWQNTVAQQLGMTAPNVSAFPPDQVDPTTNFNDASEGNKITLPLAQAYFDASDTVSTQAAAAAMTAFPCLATTPLAASCTQMVASSYGTKLFRRALASAEATTYANYLASEAKLDPTSTAVGSMLKAMLMSPNFSYRTELGNSQAGMVNLTNDEIASLLSYTLADVPPDATLTAANLSDAATRATQAQRLAALPGAKAKLTDFWSQYLALGAAPTTAGIDQYAYNEAVTFFNKVAWDGNGAFKDLVTANYTYVDPTDTTLTLAKVYGSNKPDATGKLMLDPTQRTGFLTSAAILTQTSAPSQAATVIHRGLLVRERMLCQTPPPPPANVVRDPSQIEQAGPNATARQNYAKFATDNPGCNACHTFFQPLGLAFESYDAVGKYRTMDPGGMALDLTGTLDQAGDATGMYSNVIDMASKIATSKMAQYCFTQQYAEFAFGRSVSLDQEACTVRQMGDYVTQQGGQVRQLLASFAATPSVYRRIHQ
ncbi:MAG TPA: DUF1588 domain-containing protein [Polyangia bacterium]|nr:DUF1588 domain-containing protein [Polyangia bacterium]